MKLLRHLKPEQILMVLLMAGLIVFQVWLDLMIPDFMGEIIVEINSGAPEVLFILGRGGLMLACCLGSICAAIITGFFSARVAAGFSQTLRGLVFDKVESFSMAEINKFSTASLITRSTNDIAQIQMFLAMGVQILIKAPITAVWAIIKMTSRNMEFLFSTAGAIAFMIIVLLVIIFLAMPKFKVIQTFTDKLNAVTRENLTGLRVVRAYNAEDYQHQKFETASDNLGNTNLYTNRLLAMVNPAMMAVMSGLNLAIYWIGSYIVDAVDPVLVGGVFDVVATAEAKGAVLADMMTFSGYAMQVIMSFMMLTMIFFIAPRAIVSMKRINEVMETKLTIADGTLTDSTAATKGAVEVKNVSFKYPDAEEYVLEDISFSAKPGETIAFIGSTGSGKSTIVNLIPRFYDVSAGEIIIDGVNVKDYKLEALHSKFGYVPQRGVLFSGTIESNVNYGDNGKAPADTEQIKKAVEIAQAAEFVFAKPEGLSAPIAQGGTNVSGGQKQRLSIARAVCREPEIYIFDDSFSALDYKTDRLLREALKEKTKNATIFIVAQRIGTIKDADKIIVLDEGKTAGIGTHAELMKSCEVYREIALSQLSEKELENV